MKTTKGTLDQLLSILKKVGNTEWNTGKTILAFEEFIVDLENELRGFSASKTKLLKRYVEPDMRGGLYIDPNHENYDEYVEAYAEIAKEPTDFTFKCVLQNQDIADATNPVGLNREVLQLLRSIGFLAATYEEGEKKIKEIEEDQAKLADEELEDKPLETEES